MINQLRKLWCRMFGHRFVGDTVRLVLWEPLFPTRHRFVRYRELRCSRCKMPMSELMEE